MPISCFINTKEMALVPVRVDFVATKELEPGVHVYTVNCEFSDGRVGRTEVPAPPAAPRRFSSADDPIVQDGLLRALEPLFDADPPPVGVCLCTEPFEPIAHRAMLPIVANRKTVLG